MAVTIATAFLVRDAPWWKVWLAAYAIGGTASQNLFCAQHELSHFLAFKRPIYNRVLSFASNCPLVVPMATAFRKYHQEHHSHLVRRERERGVFSGFLFAAGAPSKENSAGPQRFLFLTLCPSLAPSPSPSNDSLFQGVDGWDVDLPTALEKSAVSNLAAKLAWVFSYLAVYGLRPLVVRPKKPDASDVLCLALVLGFDAGVLYFWGPKSLAYLLAGTLLGGGLHPMAGHLIAEHYCFVSGQETYSYYGPLNALTYNVGFHNEHHDFPQVPQSRLHRLREIAPEFYEPLARHASWCWVIWTFLTDKSVGPWTRIKRERRGEATASVPGVVGEYIASLERQDEEERAGRRRGGRGENDENALVGGGGGDKGDAKKPAASPLTPSSLRKIFSGSRATTRVSARKQAAA